MIYFVVLLLLLVPVIKFDLMQKEKGRQLWYYLSLLILILLAGLRYRVGGDTIVYISLFENYPTLSELSYFDFQVAAYNPLWYLYNAPFKSIDSFTTFQIVQAIIVNVIFFKFYKRYTPYYFTAILLYYIAFYCYFNMEIQREILCVCIFMIAYPFLKAKKFLKYYLWCILALFIHYSSGIMLFVPLLLFFKKESYKKLLWICIILILSFSIFDVVHLLLSLALDGMLLVLAEHYFNLEINMLGSLYQLIQLIPILLFMYVRNKYDIKTNYILGLLMMGCAIIYVFTMFVGGFVRLLNYFMPFYILYVVSTIYELYNIYLSNKISMIIPKIAIAIMLFNFIYFYMNDMSEFYPGAKMYHRYIPYSSVINPERSEIREELIGNERARDFE